jgi:hypothetical protein
MPAQLRFFQFLYERRYDGHLYDGHLHVSFSLKLLPGYDFRTISKHVLRRERKGKGNGLASQG